MSCMAIVHAHPRIAPCHNTWIISCLASSGSSTSQTQVSFFATLLGCPTSTAMFVLFSIPASMAWEVQPRQPKVFCSPWLSQLHAPFFGSALVWTWLTLQASERFSSFRHVCSSFGTAACSSTLLLTLPSFWSATADLALIWRCLMDHMPRTYLHGSAFAVLATSSPVKATAFDFSTNVSSFLTLSLLLLLLCSRELNSHLIENKMRCV